MRRPYPLALVLLAACPAGQAGDAARFDPGPVPDSLYAGSVLYREYCSSCHGKFGGGDGLGPALLDTLYVPARLADSAIQAAVRTGFKETHSSFGDMPAVQGASPGDVTRITAYLHWLQARAGLLPDSASAQPTAPDSAPQTPDS